MKPAPSVPILLLAALATVAGCADPTPPAAFAGLTADQTQQLIGEAALVFKVDAFHPGAALSMQRCYDVSRLAHDDQVCLTADAAAHAYLQQLPAVATGTMIPRGPSYFDRPHFDARFHRYATLAFGGEAPAVSWLSDNMGQVYQQGINLPTYNFL